jgi:LuxR family maltose regulon positive regulatory protein
LLTAEAAVVVLSASAGSGKSIAIRQWIDIDCRPAATVRVTQRLTNAVAMAQSIVDALEAFGPPAPQTRGRLTDKEPAFSATVLPALATLAGSRTTPFVLVVDDVHLVQSSAAQQVLATVCEAIPTGSTVALLTRAVTPPWLARVRATGRLLEITQADLAFDSAEARAVLQGMGLIPEPTTVSDILERTEGWAVGVYLTALSLRAARTSSRRPRLTRGSDVAVADYLRTQVLATLPEERRAFLTLSSVLDELDGPLCDAVLERTDSALVLADLHEQVQLLISVDSDPPAYRCHHLLTEELRADLARCRPEELPALHERACRWFEARGERESAIQHAIATGDTELAARVIWPAVPSCVASGRLERLSGWLAGLTDSQLAENRWLTMAATWAALQQGDAAAMRRWAALAEVHAGQDWREHARHDPYAATLSVLHALARAQTLDEIRDLCDRALSGLPANDSFRTAAEFNKGVALTMLRDSDAGTRSLQEAADLARSLDVPVVEANALSWLGLMALQAGDRQRAIRLVSEAGKVVREHHLDRLVTGAVSMTMQGLILALVGDRTDASAALQTARRLTGLAGGLGPWFGAVARLLQARTAALLGDGATARQLISEARPHMIPELRASTVGDMLADTEATLALMTDHGGAATVLTTTEMRVLQYLPSHLTLQQIGEQLYVAPATVKTHVLAIYRKFGVQSRSDAVAHARALGLVESPIAN